MGTAALITWSPLSSPPADERLTFRGSQSEVLQRSYNQVSGVAHTHLHAVVTGRITPGNGQHLAARLARECGFDLVLAGPVGPHRQPADHRAGSGAELAGGVRAGRPVPAAWEEPGGTAVAGALALGTPAVGLSRGCLPELVEHGRTGWLAKSPDDLAALVQAADKIDPRECREQAARRFTPAVMAARYADLYEQLISGFVPRAGELAG
jgi:Glycosyl transferases group 1